MPRLGTKAARRAVRSAYGASRTTNSRYGAGVAASAARRAQLSANAGVRANYSRGARRYASGIGRPSPIGPQVWQAADPNPMPRIQAVRGFGSRRGGPAATAASVTGAGRRITARGFARGSLLWAGAGTVGLGVGFGLRGSGPGATNTTSMYGSSGATGMM